MRHVGIRYTCINRIAAFLGHIQTHPRGSGFFSDSCGVSLSRRMRREPLAPGHGVIKDNEANFIRAGVRGQLLGN